MKDTTKALTMLMAVLLLVALIPVIGYAAVPQQITYQGVLKDTTGNPVPDGDYEMSFALYPVPTGGIARWSEAQTVAVTNGIYNVILGQPGNELDPTDFEKGELYLGVTVGKDAEMTPRQPVTSVGYALRTSVAEAVANGAVTTIMIQNGAVDTTKVADNAITEEKLGDATVTPAKIQDGATLSEISDDDGADSGLDADLLDGLDSSAFMSAGVDNWVNEVGDTMTGKLQISVSSGEGLSSATASTESGTSAIKGYTSATYGSTYGVLGQSDSGQGRGVYGYASATSGTNYGVYGKSDSTSGYGVYGYASATGVLGRSESTSGKGVSGYATASSGYTGGVFGVSNSTDGRGVWGLAGATSGFTYGVYGQSTSTDGRGVYGYASATSGTNYGVRGESDSPDGYGVYGYASATGVHGRSDSTSGRGVHGWTTADSGTTYGVYGLNYSTSGRGVYGWAFAPTGTNYGVYGRSNSSHGYGVYGWASASTGPSYGVYGQSTSTSGRGVYGYASAPSGFTSGVYGQSNSTDGRAVWGRAGATSGFTSGVYGQSNSPDGYGVYGYASATSGWDFYAGGNGKYGPFTGAHEAKLSADFPDEVEAGLIVAATGQAQIRQNPDGSINLSSTLPTVKLADDSYDKAVFGALVAETTLPEDHWYEAGEEERFATVNALGEGRVWVTDTNGALEAGDYITTSAIPGYGQKQDDDLLHSYTLGKAIETVDWDRVTESVEYNGNTYKVYLIAVVYTSG